MNEVKDHQGGQRRNSGRRLGEREEGVHVLRLFISGMTPSSRKAIENVKRICQEQLPGCHELEIVDIYQQPQLAQEAQIVAVPTLVKLLPLPSRKMIGDMSQTGRVLHWLGLQARTASQRSHQELLAEVEELSRRLAETEEVLQAIQGGGVDALVVPREQGEQIFTLQGAEHPYRVLVENMNEGAATLAPDGTIVYCNRCLADMLQLPLEKLIGSPLKSHVASADYPIFAARLEEFAGESPKEEISLVTGEGNQLPVLFSCGAVELSAGPGASVVLTDISARKQTEQTILRLNRIYAVLSAINHAIVHTNDREAIFREFCRVAVQLGGFRLAWVGVVNKGTGSVDVAAASGETGYLDGIRISAKRGPEGMGPTSLAIREGIHYVCNDFHNEDNVHPWHRRAHVHGLYASASIAVKQNQEVIGALSLYAGETDFFDSQQVELLKELGSDISFALDNIHQEAVRRETEEALQKETAERLRAVEELSQNQRLLFQQNRQAALGEMIGNIAHQWRQPLNSLGLLVQQASLFCQMGEATQEFLDANSKKSMDLIYHMSRTIDDFGNFFKPDKEKVDFKVREVVEKTLFLLEGSLDGQQIGVEIKGKGDPVVNGYPNEFCQVLLNILFNARDALTVREIASPLVTISIGSKKGKTVLSIADNAGGIPDDIIGKVFDPYFTTKGPQAGTGVGLFMSKNIIEKNMGGLLTVRNFKEGAEFRIEI